MRWLVDAFGLWPHGSVVDGATLQWLLSERAPRAPPSVRVHVSAVRTCSWTKYVRGRKVRVQSDGGGCSAAWSTEL